MSSVPLRLSIVVPTFNERDNARELIGRIEKTLGPDGWEMVFVDDNSPDGTADELRKIGVNDTRVRVLQRMNKRGLSSACIDGMLAASADIIAVMDADLQHDETVLPKMLEAIEQNDAQLVIGTRYQEGGGTGDWGKRRKAMSKLASRVGRLFLRVPISDPMSGYFMLNREVLEMTAQGLSGLGFKILLDILLTAKQPLRVVEIPYRFRNRNSGESKLDWVVVWEYGMLLADKWIGRFIPVRFLSFSVVGSMGVLVHMAAITLLLKGFGVAFMTSQATATGIAMVFNFTLNNALTYQDRRLTGLGWFRGLITYVIVCAFGLFANVGIATHLYRMDIQWAIASLSGIVVGVVWNFAITRLYTWNNPKASENF